MLLMFWTKIFFYHLSGLGIKVVQCSLPKVASSKMEVEAKDSVELTPSGINEANSSEEEAIF